MIPMNCNSDHIPDLHDRRSIRLKGYDYSSAGAYFITICTRNRECLFGEIAVGANGIRPDMVLNKYGIIVRDEWIKSSGIRSEIKFDEFVVMPNHFHGIVIISRGDRPVAPTGGRNQRLQTRSIGSLMAGFKSAVTKRINEIRSAPGEGLWQRNYYEHIIRNDEELNGFREYINNNPMNWEADDEFRMQVEASGARP